MAVLPKEIKQVGKAMWEIPASFKKGMNVPARIVATEKLLNAMDDGVVDQVTNMACMPGIVKASYCMPDAHWGYGAPIGGVAAFDSETGVISPGVVGFDINCLHPESRILCKDGYWVTIKNLLKTPQINLQSMDRDYRLKDTMPFLFLKKNVSSKLYKVTTKTGQELYLTADHPLLTIKGYKEGSKLEEGDILVTYPFTGVEYEQPKDIMLVDEQKIEKILLGLNITDRGNARKQVLNILKKKNLLSLNIASKQIPILLKLMGFILGDGVLTFVKQKTGQLSFYGKPEDLELIRKDLRELGFNPTALYQRLRNHQINTHYGEVRFSYLESSICLHSTSLAVLLVALGMPYGNKTATGYRVPGWIFDLPLWQKRLFLGAFFGAELSTPATLNKYNFYASTLNMNKLESLQENANAYLNDIRKLLLDFGITSTEPTIVDGNQYQGKKGKSIGLRIQAHSNPQNLLALYEKINFEYNQGKRKEACLAISYQRLKNAVTQERESVRVKAKQLYQQGITAMEIKQQLTSEFVNGRFIDHSIWSGRGSPRIAFNFPSFEEFKKEAALGDDGLIKDEIAEIVTVPYHGPVFDVTMDDDNHNFIANGIISHNCGMRLLTTNLTLKEVQPKLKELVNLLFKLVPTGVGCEGFVPLNKAQFDAVIQDGVKWCVEQGYGWEDDIPMAEAHGKINGADPSKITDRARKRGINQLGTLGSGNHYLEIQFAKKENIFDPAIAKTFGINQENQVVIMVHCGSRGFGHQVATDYLKIFNDVMPKYDIKVLDKELACAPFKSKEGQDYYGAMACAANLAFANRQVIMHRIREAFSQIFKLTPEEMEMNLVYDVAHNLAKVETHKVDGKKRELVVHRKGATRSFGPGFADLPQEYQKAGQPVIVGGSMETGSYLLAGLESSEETFGSTCHGAGRTMSRTKAKQMVRGDQLQKEMEAKGIYVKSASMSGLAEEAGFAYKDITDVIEAVKLAGLSKPVVGLKPIGNIKG